MQGSQTAGGSRVAAIDVARGVALIGMAFYHLSWDFAYFRLAPADFPVIPPMRLFSHAVAGAFLMLAGVSLAIAHRGGIRSARVPAAARDGRRRGGAADRWRRISTRRGRRFSSAFSIASPRRACWRRRCFACRPGSRWRSARSLSPRPWLVSAPAFNSPALVWLGLGTVAPQTLDWRPLTPWSGLVFLGLALTRLNFARLAASPLWRWRPAARPAARSPSRGAIRWRSISSTSRSCSPFCSRRRI